MLLITKQVTFYNLVSQIGFSITLLLENYLMRKFEIYCFEGNVVLNDKVRICLRAYILSVIPRKIYSKLYKLRREKM